jgi:hypothetical protein
VRHVADADDPLDLLPERHGREERACDPVDVPDEAERQERARLVGHLSVTHPQHDAHLAMDLASRHGDGDVLEIVGGHGGDRPGVLQRDAIHQRWVGAPAHEHRYPERLRQTEELALLVALDRDHGDSAGAKEQA